MNNKKKNILAASALSLASVALAAGFAFNAYASQSDSLEKNINNFRQREMKMENLSDEQKAEMETKRAEREKEMETKRAAMQTAINSGSYETWKTAVVEQMGENAPILEKVTQDNFSQFVEAHQLMEQARLKFEAIGIKGGDGSGLMGRGHENRPSSAPVDME